VEEQSAVGRIRDATFKHGLRGAEGAFALIGIGERLGFAVAAAIAAVSTHILVMMAALLMAGAGWLLALSTFNVAVQMSAPRWVVARALSIYQMAAFGGLAAGSWLWGVLAASQSITLALAVASIVVFACAVLGRWLPLTQTEELNLDPLSRWKEPTTVVRVEARTGPVVITIEYIIREEDITEFLATMVERRRVRRRDGARSWRLLRDLADPGIWVERYETPTWLDYIRHNSRMTHHDSSISKRLGALHCGTDRPRVRRMIERQCVPMASAEQPRVILADESRLS